MDPGRAVFHHPAIPDHLRCGAVLFVVFVTSAVGGVCLFAVRDRSFAEDLRGFAAITKGATRWLATAFAYLLPNFSALNVISSVAHQQPVSGQLILNNTAYALLYATTALCGAVLIFERRNLK